MAPVTKPSGSTSASAGASTNPPSSPKRVAIPAPSNSETSERNSIGDDEAQRRLPEDRYREELETLADSDEGPRPPGWFLTPRAVVTFICGGTAGKLGIAPKFIGSKALIERCVVTLAGQRGLLLVGEPGTAKSMLSELLAAAVSGSSVRTIQGTAGTTEDQLRYGWNYALLLAKGPTPEALVPSPLLSAMQSGALVRIEEITRCLPEVQDALISVLSERRLQVPELSGTPGESITARPGFNVIATANLRDRGVSEMSAALKRRFNFEQIDPIASLADEIKLVSEQASVTLGASGVTSGLDASILEALVTVFRDLRSGKTAEGWPIEQPGSVMSTAEAVSVATAMGLQQAYLGGARDALGTLPGHLLGVVRKDDPADMARLRGYWDVAVKRRADAGTRMWQQLWELRSDFE
jgi:MoxR-like ATPase